MHRTYNPVYQWQGSHNYLQPETVPMRIEAQ